MMRTWIGANCNDEGTYWIDQHCAVYVNHEGVQSIMMVKAQMVVIVDRDGADGVDHDSKGTDCRHQSGLHGGWTSRNATWWG